jgi:hypothetical protein
MFAVWNGRTLAVFEVNRERTSAKSLGECVVDMRTPGGSSDRHVVRKQWT